MNLNALQILVELAHGRPRHYSSDARPAVEVLLAAGYATVEELHSSPGFIAQVTERGRAHLAEVLAVPVRR